jgi:dsDNA-binding SOS-regulon protein
MHSKQKILALMFASALSGAAIRDFLDKDQCEVCSTQAVAKVISIPKEVHSVEDRSDLHNQLQNAIPTIDTEETTKPSTVKSTESHSSDDLIEWKINELSELVEIDPALHERLYKYFKEEGERMGVMVQAAQEHDNAKFKESQNWQYTETLEQILGTETYQDYVETEQQQRDNEKSEAFLAEALYLQRKVGLPPTTEAIVIKALKEGQFEYYGRGFTTRTDASEEDDLEARSKKIIEILSPHLTSEKQRNELLLYLASTKEHINRLPMVHRSTE